MVIMMRQYHLLLPLIVLSQLVYSERCNRVYYKPYSFLCVELSLNHQTFRRSGVKKNKT